MLIGPRGEAEARNEPGPLSPRSTDCAPHTGHDYRGKKQRHSVDGSRAPNHGNSGGHQECVYKGLAIAFGLVIDWFEKAQPQTEKHSPHDNE
jgi:hypothetical protein